ncbi:M23 family metallopeptidase [Hephaestia sp. GCM10023244]|uniref:M23 family metallopeptidase n=1 Tax=unclassified Hephaestia TaxID=2631281 RepID=UPI00207790F1|nr:M23 family metallopeptidase [Hephaestia sp. MAHUQ-44]MCM8730990.1 M23 family metallopeptidase [Hephaestia sp. MAHUQ-44]
MIRAVRPGALVALAALASCVGPPAAMSPPKPSPPPPPALVPLQPATFEIEGAVEQGGALVGTAPVGTASLTFDGTAIPMAPDRTFLVAFDRDHGPSALLVATLSDGRRVSKALTVAPRGWDISRLGSLPKYPVPSATFQRLRPTELAQIAAARATDHASDGWRQRFIWPATGRISTNFGSQRIYQGGEKGAYHSGTDVAVPSGTPIVAPADGVVILATDQPFTLEGYLLMIDHGMGLNSAFLHLSAITVKVGDRVRQGQVIARSGASGRATGPHLHWGLKWRDARLDPALLTGPMPGG